MRKALVLKKQADLFSVKFEDGNEMDCVARKVLKKDGIFVGDYVSIDADNAICKIEKRKNILIRPPMANIDQMFIVVAPVPKPDLYMVDKLLIFCALNAIEPILCINKADLDKTYCEKVAEIYKSFVKVLVVSSKDETVFEVENVIKGIAVLAGQSAVGKSSIINALKKSVVTKVDDFSKKIERGKQTTRTVQLFEFGNENYLADTAGFSKLDESLLLLKETELKDYYPDFLEYASNCKYKTCVHTSSKNCGIVEAVKQNKISKERYQNYLKLFEIVKNIKRY